MFASHVKSQILVNILHPLRGGTPRRPTPLLALSGKSEKGDWSIVVFRVWRIIRIFEFSPSVFNALINHTTHRFNQPTLPSLFSCFSHVAGLRQGPNIFYSCMSQFVCGLRAYYVSPSSEQKGGPGPFGFFRGPLSPKDH